MYYELDYCWFCVLRKKYVFTNWRTGYAIFKLLKLFYL